MVNCSLPRLVGGVVAALSILLAIAAPSRALTAEEAMRFTYWTECSPLRLAIVVIDPESAARVGLTEEVVATAVRSRLRAARLYTDTDNLEIPLLVMHVDVASSKRITGGAFLIDVALHKPLHDPLTGLSSYAHTNYPHGLAYRPFGLHAGKAAFILSQIGLAMDGFLDAYLRVNEPACY